EVLRKLKQHPVEHLKCLGLIPRHLRHLGGKSDNLGSVEGHTSTLRLARRIPRSSLLLSSHSLCFVRSLVRASPNLPDPFLFARKDPSCACSPTPYDQVRPFAPSCGLPSQGRQSPSQASPRKSFSRRTPAFFCRPW